MIKHIIFIILILPVANIAAADADLEIKLRIIKEVYNLKPKDCEILQVVNSTQTQIKSGEVIFKSKLFSGDRDTSCQTCHLDRFAITDGLSLAVGVGGDDEGFKRLYDGHGTLVQRNTITLIGRGSVEFKNYFWDGKVDVGDDGKIYSQFGEHLSDKFKSQLAVAAILPLIERDEFVGKKKIFRQNDIQKEMEDSLYQKRYEAISRALKARIIDDEGAEVRNALLSAGEDIDDFELADLGELLSHFIANNFKCETSEWDEYLAGADSSMSVSALRGAALYYGKGRCVGCHNGPLLSDFKFHSIGVPQGLFGPHSRHRDLGRAAITLSGKDLYLFRTPPLIDVSKTPPYGHNGIFETLQDIVVHHYDPIKFYTDNKELYKKTKYDVGKINDSRSKLLSMINLRTDDELKDLLEFLNTL